MEERPQVPRKYYPQHRSQADVLQWPTAFVYHPDFDTLKALHLAVEVAGFRVRGVQKLEEKWIPSYGVLDPLIILHLKYPNPSGLEILRRVPLKRDGVLGVAALVAGGDQLEQGVAHALGVTLWVPSDAGIEEFMRRLTTALRETRLGTARWYPTIWGRFFLGSILVDTLARFAEVRGQRRKLTALQTRLLMYLAENGHKYCSQVAILRDVWGLVPPITKTKRVHTLVKRLRDLLGTDGPAIEWRPGDGCRLAGLFAEVVQISQR